MKVVFHEDFYQVYTHDPAAMEGRMEAVMEALRNKVDIVEALPAEEGDIQAVHPQSHIEYVRHCGLYAVSALAAGGAVQAAEIGLAEPAFGLIRPPGHHASADSCWGFCYFNNMAVAMESLRRQGRIQTGYVLDIDLHFGDGTVNILGDRPEYTVCNVEGRNRRVYMDEVGREMENCTADIIGISAGFDYHQDDWGGLLKTEDYLEIGRMVRMTADRLGSGCFALLEGGYNHDVLGQNALALIQGMATV